MNQKFFSYSYLKAKLIFIQIIQRVIFFGTGLLIEKRMNKLTQQDIYKILLKVRRGDILLMGIFHEATSLLIPGALTHSGLYVGRRKVIHAIAPMVQYAYLHDLLKHYDTFAILRIPRATKRRLRIIRKTIRFAKQMVGKPYGFDADSTIRGKFFCTELINKAYRQAGYKTKLKSLKPFLTFFEKIEKIFITARKALLPSEFLYGNFEVVFLSHNLELRGKKLVLKEY